MKPLEKLFWDELAEMIHIEEMLLKAFPKMRDAANSPSLQKTLETYRLNSQMQVERVRKIFETFDTPPREKKCDAMMGLLLRGQHLMQRSGAGDALDAALLCVARKINGYKVVSYGSLVSWAEAMEVRQVVRILEKPLRQEEEIGGKLDALAPECDAQAAGQGEEPARGAAPRTRKAAVAA